MAPTCGQDEIPMPHNAGHIFRHFPKKQKITHNVQNADRFPKIWKPHYNICIIIIY